MTVPKTTRTHLVYQFIILTLLFLGIGYNELLPDRKFILFLAFIPMFCCQLFILSCCMELLPIPSWMNFGESLKAATKEVKSGTDSLPNSPASSDSSKQIAQKQVKKSLSDFSEIVDRTHSQKRWEKSTTNLRQPPKPDQPQKSKSWMNLSDSKPDSEKSISREGSLDTLADFSERKRLDNVPLVADKDHKEYRKERANRAQSWKPNSSDFNELDDNAKTEQKTKLLEKERIKPCHLAGKKEDSELTKSYSFPFRQKRLETWLEMKESEIAKPSQVLNRPYWQSASYKLAVKYEARRRRRAISTPTEYDESEISLHNNFHKSVEIPKESIVPKANQKKPAKSAAACISKIKISFSNLMTKKKDDNCQNWSVNVNKIEKPKVKNRNLPLQSKKQQKPMTMQEFPQFLSTERPLIFYPKHLPYEKERFESDVKEKIIELDDE